MTTTICSASTFPARRAAGERRGARSRRGSVLVLIVGALALISVIAVVYFTLGRADRRTSAVVVRNNTIDSDIAAITEHITSVVADDIFSTFPDDNNPAARPPNQRRSREAWDYPWADPAFRSDRAANDADHFTPAGEGSDPWLASTEPTWLNFRGAPPTDPTMPYLHNKDWASITNIAPDGRFVNLANLRNNFSARPGSSMGEMSYALSLWGDTDQPVQTLDFGGGADLDVPAHWTSRQRGAFRPMNDSTLDPGDPENLFNQWADADGDGMADSRWVELMDAAGLTSGGDASSVLPGAGLRRWFIAARIMDLGGLINVNAAADFRARPNRQHPAGQTPADVDLRRLLTMRDLYTLDGNGYELFEQPADPNSVMHYGAADEANAAISGANAYEALRESVETGVVPPPNADFTGLQPWTAALRSDHYLEVGGRADGASYPGASSGYLLGGVFGLSDQLELLTYRGVNDPGTTSRLERVLGGRNLTMGQRRYSVLRDNRSLDLERGFRFDDGDNAAGPADLDAMAWSAFDARQRLTAVNGARPLVSDITYDPARTHRVNAATELALDPTSIIEASGARDLFLAYADALLPASDLEGAWPGAGQDDRLRTMFYGYPTPDPTGGSGTGGGDGPELPLRIAAHLAVNMADSYDKDDEPGHYTLLVDESYRDPVIMDAVRYPWWLEGDQLDLGGGRLANTLDDGDMVESPAVNIYGIEVQPFLTEVAVFTVYTDARDELGEEPDTDPDAAPKLWDDVVDIKGDIDANNNDLVFRMVAFQLTNPFDRDVILSTAGGDVRPGTAVDVERDFYYIQFGKRHFKLAELTEDTANVDPDRFLGTASLRGITIPAGETIVCYATSQPLPDLVERISLIEGTPANTDPLIIRNWIEKQLKGAGISEAVQIVEFDESSGLPLADLGSFDPVIDNNTDPVEEVRLWRTLRALAEIAPLRNVRENDLLADRFRIPDSNKLDRRLLDGQHEVRNAIAGPEDVPPPDSYNQGLSVTLWASVRRRDDPRDPESGEIPLGAFPAYCIEPKTGAWNDLTTDGIDLGSLELADFVTDPGPPTATYETLRDLRNSQSEGAPNSAAVCTTIASPPESKSGLVVTPVYMHPEIHLNNNQYRHPQGNSPVSALRLADLLLPLGVGPSYDPLLDGVRDDDGWTTLGEGLALAFGYGGPPAPGTLDAQYEGTLDRGHLVIDDYVPFFDADMNGVFDPGTADQRRGLGIPLALNVLEVFRTLRAEYGSFTRATPGLININTASPAVLRALPMLSPTAVPSEWWWTGGAHGPQSDIAATLLAYRDTAMTWPRNAAATGYDTVPIDFREENDGDLSNDNSREAATEVVALRSQPGLRSVGEVLLARNRLGGRAQNSIDYLSENDLNDSKLGVDSTFYNEAAPGNDPPTDPDEIDDEYDEGLLLANGLLNTVSVRSDVFAVWFIVHGYLRSDVEGPDGRPLADDEIMVPSVARRYVMVLDRSNVVQKGDKPKVLLFQQVPM